jgi:hypothetical protein
MVSIQNIDATIKQVAGILVKMEAVLEDVFTYYKFGRYESGFPEKPYFLLSHCSHLLFLLWRTEQDNGGAIFQETRRPAAFRADLDFGTLRYTDYARRMLHGTPLDEHLKNEPQWFKFWLKLLDALNSSGSATYHEFSRHILAQVEQHGFTDAMGSRKDRRQLGDLFRTDEAGCFLLRSVSVLEDLVSTLTDRFATLDPGNYIIEQVLSLVCLLSRIRQIIIYQMPARGPYASRDWKIWAMPWLLRRVYAGKTQGVLTVVPRREGGRVLCTYHWESGSARRCWSWTVKTSERSGTYEESLFKTWPHDENEHRPGDAKPTDDKASWIIQSVEAHHLETISQHVDTLLDTLRKNPWCDGLVGTVAGVARNDHARWKPSQLPWMHIGQLDHVLEQLKSLCREAAVGGGDNPAERLVRRIWPVRQQATDAIHVQVSTRLGDEVQPAARTVPAGTINAAVPAATPLSVTTEIVDVSEPAPAANVAESLTLPVQIPSNEQVPPDLTIRPDRGVAETRVPDEARDEATVPTCEIHIEPPERSEPRAVEESAAGARDMQAGLNAGAESAAQELQRAPKPDECSLRANEPATVPGASRNARLVIAGHQAGTRELMLQIDKLDACSRVNQPLETDKRHESDLSKQHSRAESAGSVPPTVVRNGAVPDCLPRERAAAKQRGRGLKPGRRVPETAVRGGQGTHAAKPSGRKMGGLPVSPSREDRERQSPNRTSTPNGSLPPTGDHLLVQELLQHHRRLRGPAKCTPVSLMQLRQRLQWSPARVQRAMARVFGAKPFRVYREKCKDRTISTFLQRFVVENGDALNADVRAIPVST